MNNATWLDNQIVSIPSVPESLATNAFAAFPSRPLPELAMAKYAEDSAGADFLRSQALNRLPKDSAICTKAGEMLRDQRQGLTWPLRMQTRRSPPIRPLFPHVD